MNKRMMITLITGLTISAAACSSSHETASDPVAATVAPAAAAAPATRQGAGQKDEIPAAVRAALPKAQWFTKQHKDLTPAQAASVEKKSGVKLADKDHHSYLAFANEGGARKQIGAATVVKAQGREVVVVYGNKNGSPVISEVHGEAGGVPHAFLDQFKGKGHDDELSLGQDIRAQGVAETLARALADLIRLDVMTMQALYGAAHTH